MEENDTFIPIKGVVPVSQLFGDDDEDTKLFREMAADSTEVPESRKSARLIRHTTRELSGL